MSTARIIKSVIFKSLWSAEVKTDQGSLWSVRSIAWSAEVRRVSGIDPNGYGLLSRTQRVLERNGHLGKHSLVRIVEDGHDILLPLDLVDTFLALLDGEVSAKHTDVIRKFFAIQKKSHEGIQTVSISHIVQNSDVPEAVVFGTYGKHDIEFVDVSDERLVKAHPLVEAYELESPFAVAFKLSGLHQQSIDTFVRKLNVRTQERVRHTYWFTRAGVNAFLDFCAPRFPDDVDTLRPFLDELWEAPGVESVEHSDDEDAAEHSEDGHNDNTEVAELRKVVSTVAEELAEVRKMLGSLSQESVSRTESVRRANETANSACREVSALRERLGSLTATNKSVPSLDGMRELVDERTGEVVRAILTKMFGGDVPEFDVQSLIRDSDSTKSPSEVKEFIASVCTDAMEREVLTVLSKSGPMTETSLSQKVLPRVSRKLPEILARLSRKGVVHRDDQNRLCADTPRTRP